MSRSKIISLFEILYFICFNPSLFSGLTVKGFCCPYSCCVNIWFRCFIACLIWPDPFFCRGNAIKDAGCCQCLASIFSFHFVDECRFLWTLSRSIIIWPQIIFVTYFGCYSSSMLLIVMTTPLSLSHLISMRWKVYYECGRGVP